MRPVFQINETTYSTKSVVLGAAVAIILAVCVGLVFHLYGIVQDLKPDPRSIAISPTGKGELTNNQANQIIASAIIMANKGDIGFVADCFDRALENDFPYASKVLAGHRITYQYKKNLAVGFNPAAQAVDDSEVAGNPDTTEAE